MNGKAPCLKEEISGHGLAGLPCLVPTRQMGNISRQEMDGRALKVNEAPD